TKTARRTSAGRRNLNMAPLLSRGGESRRGSGGWGGAGQTNYLLTTTTPSARAKVASQLFLCRAATPPRLRRGVYWRFHFPIGNRWSIATFNRATLTRGSPRKPRSAFSVYCRSEEHTSELQSLAY